jgi:hypothetical protein
MNEPSPKYHDVARKFREHARAERGNLVPHPATPEEVDAAERDLGAAFPDSFRWFQLEFGDFKDGPFDIYSVLPPDSSRSPETSQRNIVGINQEERVESVPRLPPHLIAFSDSGGGDYLCFDTSRRVANECPVVWWDHEQDETQTPEPAAASFLDWIEAEISEREMDEKRSLLDSFPYKDWLAPWLKPRE